MEKRENWASKFGMIMAFAGMAIGIGNCWRFPYLVGQYGGGSFVLAYLILMLIIVVPLALIEAGIGKGLQGGCIDAWRVILKNKTAGTFIGGAFSISYAMENFFAIVVTSQALYYAIMFISGKTASSDVDILYENMLTNYVPLLAICVVVTLAVVAVVILGVVKGIENVCKYFIPLIILIFAMVTLVSAFTVPGISAGYNFYLAPDWSKFFTFDLWKAALTQALFSIGVGPGCVLVYGSHCKKKDDIVLSMLTVCMLDMSAALLAGFAIIPTCIAMGLDPQSGAGLLFKVLPAALAKIPGGAIMGMLAMLAVFFAQFTSDIAQMETAITSISDGCKVKRMPVIIVTAVITLIMVIACTVSKSQFALWNNIIGNYAFLITAAIGGFFYCYIFGIKKIRTQYINEGASVKLGRYFDLLVMAIAMPLMIIIMLDSLFPFLG